MEVKKVHLKAKSYTMTGGFDAFRAKDVPQPPGNVSTGQFESVELSPEGIEITTTKETLWYPWGSVDHLTIKKAPAIPSPSPSSPALPQRIPAPYGVQALTDDREPVAIPQPAKKDGVKKQQKPPVGIIELKAA